VLGVANPLYVSTLSTVASFLVRVAFLLLGMAALLGGVALLHRPELPQRLVAWLTKRENLPLTAGRRQLELAR